MLRRRQAGEAHLEPPPPLPPPPVTTGSSTAASAAISKTLRTFRGRISALRAAIVY